VDPLGLVVKNSIWYLVAGTAAGQRTFRVSRVRSLQLTTEPSARPDDFDLAQAWSSILTTVDAQRTPVRVRVRAGPTIIDVLRYIFGNRVGEGVEQSDGRIEVELRAQSELMVARQLAGFGDGLEVVAPESVRAHLAAIGQDLLRAHT
jgi:predicted DNA-binding transcriptional regulator YafY